MKNIITIAFLLCSIGVSAQSKFTSMPDCNKYSLFKSTPCKVPVIKNGKVVGYTVENNHHAETMRLTGEYKSLSMNSFNMTPPRYSFMYNGKTTLQVSHPYQTTGIDTIYIHKSKLHWINDSTAVIKPSNK